MDVNGNNRHGLFSFIRWQGQQSDTAPRLRALWVAWSLANLAAFVAALVLPLVELRQLYVFRHDIVLINVPAVLWHNAEYFLSAVVFVFGIVLPLGKALLYCIAAARPRLIDWLGRFAPLSFFDVFMIALLIFVAKGTVGADAASGIGIYPLLFFALSSKAIELLLGPRMAPAAVATRAVAAAGDRSPPPG